MLRCACRFCSKKLMLEQEEEKNEKDLIHPNGPGQASVKV